MGLNTTEISREMGMRSGNVLRYARAHGISVEPGKRGGSRRRVVSPRQGKPAAPRSPRQPRNLIDGERLREFAEQGYSATEIGRLMGLGIGAAGRYARVHRIPLARGPLGAAAAKADPNRIRERPNAKRALPRRHYSVDWDSFGASSEPRRQSGARRPRRGRGALRSRRPTDGVGDVARRRGGRQGRRDRSPRQQADRRRGAGTRVPLGWVGPRCRVGLDDYPLPRRMVRAPDRGRGMTRLHRHPVARPTMSSECRNGWRGRSRRRGSGRLKASAVT